MHVMAHQRVKDLLNGDETFLAVTDATIRRPGDSDAQQAEFIAINKQHIVSVIPINEPQQMQYQEEY